MDTQEMDKDKKTCGNCKLCDKVSPETDDGICLWGPEEVVFPKWATLSDDHKHCGPVSGLSHVRLDDNSDCPCWTPMH